MKLSLVALAALATVAVTGSSAAAVLVVGESLAHDCYLGAEFHPGDATVLRDCSEALDGALSLRNRVSTLVNRGIVKSTVGATDSALADYDLAIATDATFGEAYINRSAVLIALKRYREAMADASKAIDLHANRLEVAYFNRAVANEQLGNVRGAYDDFRAALQIEPKFTAATEQLTRFKVVNRPANGT